MMEYKSIILYSLFQTNVHYCLDMSVEQKYIFYEITVMNYTEHHFSKLFM